MEIRNIILNLAQKRDQVVYGARSVNVQLPIPLRKETKDYDILTKNAKGSAEELRDLLNKKFGKDKFKVEQANHLKTYKVKDNEGNNIADYTQTTKKPKSKNSLGINYAGLHYQRHKIMESLKNPGNDFRRVKDLDTLKRIRESQRRIFWW